MSARFDPRVTLVDEIGDEATQAANGLVRALAMGPRPAQGCSCADSKFEVTADNDRVHVAFDPNRRCPTCGLAEPASRLSDGS